MELPCLPPPSSGNQREFKAPSACERDPTWSSAADHFCFLFIDTCTVLHAGSISTDWL